MIKYSVVIKIIKKRRNRKRKEKKRKTRKNTVIYREMAPSALPTLRFLLIPSLDSTSHFCIAFLSLRYSVPTSHFLPLLSRPAPSLPDGAWCACYLPCSWPPDLQLSRCHPTLLTTSNPLPSLPFLPSVTMALQIPSEGLSLRPGDQSGDSATKPAQIMRLNLAQNTLDELIQNLRSDQPVRVRLGKHPSLHYAGKTQSFHAYPETHRSEIYHTSADDNDKQNLYFAGVLSHSLEVEKAQEATAATDQALANLEESLNAFERGKESKKTHIVHPDEVNGVLGKIAHHYRPKTKVDRERDRVLRASANRSLATSPTMGALKSPGPIPPPTSAPTSQTKTDARLDALKTPFTHLLAVRAVSAKFLARQTCSSIEDCTALAQKYGTENRLNREKFDLRDKAYKDLDVWKFPYPTQEDRQQAIDNAISAFDRMRISRTDELWQKLLPKEERGKGKYLSRLNLTAGPIKKPAPAPRIQVDGVDDRAKDGDVTGNETDRGNAPRSSTSTPKVRAEKEAPKRATKGKAANNSTLTGRVTKKTERKNPAKVESKFKSDEFVHDSDDDDDEEMPDAAPSPPAAAAPAARPKQAKPAPAKKAQAPAPKSQPAAKARPQAGSTTTKLPKSEAATPKLEPSKSTKAPVKKPASRLSTSPQKPTLFGSSPPTNASAATQRSRSNSQNQTSSSSSSPLISQVGRSTKPTTAATTTTTTRPAKSAAQTNGVTKLPASNPLKRKADADRVSTPHTAPAPSTGNLDHKRRRAISTSSGGSTGSASPPMSQELLRQQLREKSQKFKQNYVKYTTLYHTLEKHTNPPNADLERLQKQHVQLQRMKREIWEEDKRLRDGVVP